MDKEAPRLPTDAERAVLYFLLTPDFPGVEAFRVQARTAKVQTDCVCGCGSFTIFTDDDAPAASEWESMTPRAMDPERVIDMFMFVQAGRLVGTEITYYDGPSNGVPSISGFKWD